MRHYSFKQTQHQRDSPKINQATDSITRSYRWMKSSLVLYWWRAHLSFQIRWFIS